MSSAQVKKKAVSKGKRIFGTILLLLGILLLFAAVVNAIAGLMEESMYYSMNNLSGAARCGIIGGLFTGLGIRLRKKK